MKRKKSKKKSTAEKKAPSPAQKAHRYTWLIKGRLKSSQMEYLRIGGMLVKVQDEKMFVDLGYATIEGYAEERLQLGRSSLYQYIQVYEWAAKFHPEWIGKKPKGGIPSLYDVADLIWIEHKLEEKNLSPAQKTALEELREKALAGTLRSSELGKFRRREQTVKQALKGFLSKLRLLRMRGSQMASMPEEVIKHLNAAIELLANDSAIKLAGMGLSGLSGADRRGFYMA